MVKSEYGPGPTDIHCTFFGSSVVYITNGEDSTSVLEGFTLFNDRGGMAGLRSRERDFAGGGICIDSASPVVRGNVIKNSEAQGGGGIYCNCSSALIEDNVIRGNSTYQSGGGGVFVASPAEDGPLRLVGNTITDNEISGAYGGGIYAASWVNLIGNDISGNAAATAFSSRATR